MRMINRNILNERLSSKVYHFTSYEVLKNIIETDSMFLQNSCSDKREGRSNRIFYLSLSRIKSTRQGYALCGNLPVRIELDGNKLNQRYKGKAIDYFMGKINTGDYQDGEGYDDLSGNRLDSDVFEYEDRLFSDKPIIDHIMNYIIRIDVVFTKNTSYLYIPIMKQIANIDNVFIYGNRHDFEAQNINTINDKFSSLKDSECGTYTNKEPYTTSSFINDITSMFVILTYGEYDNGTDAVNFINRICDKYQIDENVKQQVIKVIESGFKFLTNSERIETSIKSLDELRSLISPSIPRKIYEKLCKIFFYEYCKPNGFKNSREVWKHKEDIALKYNKNYELYADNKPKKNKPRTMIAEGKRKIRITESQLNMYLNSMKGTLNENTKSEIKDAYNNIDNISKNEAWGVVRHAIQSVSSLSDEERKMALELSIKFDLKAGIQNLS